MIAAFGWFFFGLAALPLGHYLHGDGHPVLGFIVFFVGAFVTYVAGGTLACGGEVEHR